MICKDSGNPESSTILLPGASQTLAIQHQVLKADNAMINLDYMYAPKKDVIVFHQLRRGRFGARCSSGARSEPTTETREVSRNCSRGIGDIILLTFNTR